jgi:hypothetical protein
MAALSSILLNRFNFATRNLFDSPPIFIPSLCGLPHGALPRKYKVSAAALGRPARAGFLR